ncbi:MAG: PAS domain-containing protein [Anaerolineales bacterium]|nr:PAS domain-containing protein [Anaerolineales bacterium]MDW8162695.1 PAS domain-containing protein [Anaerolineales bacterium]
MAEWECSSAELERMCTLFSALFNRFPAGGVLVDKEGLIREANLAFCSLIGCEPSQVVGKSIQDFLHEEDRSDFLARCPALFRQAQEEILELRLRGTRQPPPRVRLQAGRLSLSGEPKGTEEADYLLLTFSEIDERGASEFALRNLLGEYETLFNGLQDAVFLIEVGEEGEFRYLRTNAAYQQKIGVTSERIRERTPAEVLGPEWSAEIRDHCQRCVESGRPVAYEQTLDSPAGRRTWLTTLTPVWSAGRIKYLIGTSIETTEQRATQEAIRQNGQRYRILFENLMEGFALHEMIWDENGKPLDYRFLEVNPAFERLTGLKAEEIVGKTVLQVLPGLERVWIERYGEVAASGKAMIFEEYSAPLQKWYEVRAFSPEPGYFATVFIDITQRKRWQEEREQLIQDLQRKNSELSQFTYTVSHDLRGPLITILGFLTFVEQSLEQGDVEQAKADLQRIRFAAEKMQALLEGLLELSRVGRVLNSLDEFPFGEVVTEAAQLLLGNIRHQGRPIEFEIAPDLPVVQGDRARLSQVVQNLLDNALKYMGEQPNPRIEIGWRDAPGEFLFYVRDNGMGIDPSYQDKVFGLFEKLDPRTEGYGIGLALVKRIVEVHGGRVWAESEGRGKGCTFWFTLPKVHRNLS